MNRKLRLFGAFTALTLLSGAVFAAEQYHDTRYHMDHYYPARGASVGTLPSKRKDPLSRTPLTNGYAPVIKAV